MLYLSSQKVDKKSSEGADMTYEIPDRDSGCIDAQDGRGLIGRNAYVCSGVSNKIIIPF